MELTVESLIAELGLTLVCGQESAQAHVRWVHSTELLDPTPWLKGGELLLTMGIQLTGPKAQRELIATLADHEIAGLGFGTGFTHKKLPAALLSAARKREFPLFEVPYELPFIAITERAFAQLLDERYEMLQRNMVGDVLAEALTAHLYPEELQARLRPFGIGEQVAVLAFKLPDPSAAAALLERILEREEVHNLVAIRAGLLCAVIDADGQGKGDPPNPIELARKLRAELGERFGEVRAAASRPAATHSLRLSFHEARCALEAVRLQNGDAPRGGDAPEVASYRDLGAFQLLLSLQDDDALISYCRGVLGPVEQGEGEYGDELLRSLDVFIEHNGHWEKAAGALYCHRHTLRYRIRRVEQLTGRDFSQARDRIEFWLALRGRELAR
ncbi:MAG TPA: PucR family transcriptional regulator ligand-binding domain-containing protein [Solirubrobacteraceae bacterium]|jgi:purine catabolism regulator|nr:PucR family transcriptional regulator ligand-binding domain-containing protein [Solirubrobacteraceae bacterium]